jgi:hypothetical protein
VRRHPGARRRAGWLALLALAVLCPLTAVRAQVPSGPIAPTGRPVTADATRAVTPEVVVVGKDAVITSGAPRTFIVVSVPVPTELPLESSVSFEVQAHGAFTIIGRRGGTLEPSSTARSLLVTLGIPARARAGRLVAAKVAFEVPGLPRYEVPVEVEVAAVRRLTIVTTPELSGFVGGDRIDVRYRVVNGGNVRDTVEMKIVAPEGWRARQMSGTTQLIIDPGADLAETVRLSVPGASSTGDFFMRLEASSGGEVRSQAPIAIEIGDRTTGGMPVGPTLTSTLAGVSSAGQSASILSLGLQGPVSTNVQISGRATISTQLETGLSRGLARVGAFPSAPYLSAWSPTWRVSAGNTTASFNDLAGVNAWGTGLSGSVKSSAGNFSALAARATSSPLSTKTGGLVGASYETTVSGVPVTATLSHLLDEQAVPRELSAFSIGSTLPELHLGTLNLGSASGALAYRNFSGGSGLGWLGQVAHGVRENRIEMRIAHAPGGTDAFARTRDEVSLLASHAFTPRWQMSGSLYSASDSNRAFAGTTSRAAGITQQFLFNKLTSISVDARTSSFSATGASASMPSFGDSERRLSTTVSTRRGRMGYNGELAFESVTRTAGLEEGLSSDVSGLRAIWRGSADIATSNGAYQFENTYEHSAPGAGFLPQQMSFAARASQVRISLLPRDVLLNAEIEHQSYGVARSAINILRVGAEVPLPNGFGLVLNTEYNPLFDNTISGSPWIFSVKVERGLSLPRLRISSTSGYVFQDLNSNSVRDPGEPGVGNVVVHQGDARAVTKSDGRYEFWEKTRGAASVELSSLPYGWVLGELPKRLDAGHKDIALVPTSSIEIALVLSAEPGGRVPEADLSQVVVFARDDAGREWQARRTTSEAAVFDALPVGTYQLDFDFAALAEPLRLKNKITLRVSGQQSEHIVAQLYGRPLRFKVPQSTVITSTTPKP